MAINTANGGESRENAIVVLAGLAVAFFIGIQVYKAYAVEIHAALLVLAQLLLFPIKVVTGPLAVGGLQEYLEWPTRLYEGLDKLRGRALTFSELLIVYGAVGKLYNVLLIPLLGWALWRTRGKSMTLRFSRQLDMKTLLRQNVKLYPILAPVAHRNLDQEPLFEGRWRMAMSQVEWAVYHQMIIPTSHSPVVPHHLEFPKANVSPPKKRWAFDMRRARQVTAEQLGLRMEWGILPPTQVQALLNRMSSLTQWMPKALRIDRVPTLREPINVPDHIIALAGVFMAFDCNQRESARKALDSMALSYKEGQSTDKDRLDCRAGIELFYSFQSKHKYFDEIRQRHGVWSSVWLTALYRNAQLNGSLPPSEFIWLRPFDRPLWYALNQVGRGGMGGDKGHVAWAEAVGVASHFDAEHVLGQAIEEPALEVAIDQVGEMLFRQGWVGDRV